MDELSALERALLQGECGRSAEGSPVPGAKRGIVRCASSLDIGDEAEPQSAEKKRKAGVLRSSSSTDLLPASPTSASTERVKRPCPGCSRTCDEGLDCVTPCTPVAWALPDNRGAWCKGCFSVWRTKYSTSMSLSIFGAWLSKGTNGEDFLLHLIAFFCLKAEGVDKITAALLTGRAESLKIALRLLGLPVSPCTVVALQDIVDKKVPVPPDWAPTGGALCTIRASDGDRVAVYVPQCPRSETILLDRPIDFMPLLRSTVAGSPHDVELLQTMFEDFKAPNIAQNQSSASSLAIVPYGSQHVQTKLEIKCECAIGLCKNALAKFAEQDWAEIFKESMLTIPLQKICSLGTEARSSGQQRVIDLSSSWIDGMTASQTFLKRQRAFTKAKSKHSKLHILMPNIQHLVKFLRDQELGVASTLGLLEVKVEFFNKLEGSVKHGVVFPAVQHVLELGLPSLMKDMIRASADHSRFSSQSWLRALVLDGFEQAIAYWPSADLATQVPVWLHDVASVAEALAQQQPSFGDIEAFLQDIGALHVLLEAASTPPRASAARARQALQLIGKSKTLQGIKAALNGSEGGLAIQADASALMARSAKDAVADERAASAMKALRGEGGVRYEEDMVEGGARLAFEGHLSVDLVLNTLTESLVSMTEALAMWSSIRQGENADVVREWATVMTDACRKLDVYFSTQLLAVHNEHLSRGGTGALQIGEQENTGCRCYVLVCVGRLSTMVIVRC